MYISVRPVNFTDDELEKIYFAVNVAYDDLADSSDPDDSESLADYKKLAMELLYGILAKIEKSGMFSDIGLSNEGGED